MRRTTASLKSGLSAIALGMDRAFGLDPSRRTAKVTREVAAKLAELAKSLEQSGYAADLVAQFLMRCLFTFFAEDVGLLPKDCFTSMLSDPREKGRTDAFPDMASSLWTTMKTGGFVKPKQSAGLGT
jgi:hypothetical protein